MSYEILATPNSIASGRYSIGEKETNLFLIKYKQKGEKYEKCK